MLCKTVNAMSFAEYSYESEFESYESSLCFLYPSTGQKQTSNGCGASSDGYLLFRTLLVDSFRQAAFFCCLQYRKAAKENERSNHRYPANRCQYQGTAKSGRHQGKGCGGYARCLHTGGSQMAGRHCTSYHRQPCDSRRDARSKIDDILVIA